MTTYVHTDERQDVLASLEHCATSLAETERSDGAWKWVIPSLHSALQGAMVCHLSGTAEVGALTSTCACKWAEWHDRDRRGDIAYVEDGVDEFGLPVRRPRTRRDQPPHDHVASAAELFRRLGLQSERIESGCGGIIEITAAQRKSFETLHRLRNGFTHFSPKGWSIELQLIRDIFPDILDIIEQIANDWWPFRHMSDIDRKLLRDRISELRSRFADAPIGASPM